MIKSLHHSTLRIFITTDTSPKGKILIYSLEMKWKCLIEKYAQGRVYVSQGLCKPGWGWWLPVPRYFHSLRSLVWQSTQRSHVTHRRLCDQQHVVSALLPKPVADEQLFAACTVERPSRFRWIWQWPSGRRLLPVSASSTRTHLAVAAETRHDCH